MKTKHHFAIATTVALFACATPQAFAGHLGGGLGGAVGGGFGGGLGGAAGGGFG